MSLASVVAAVLLGSYFVVGFSLILYVEALRGRGEDPQTLPARLAFFGPASWAYAFSSRHRDAHDKVLSVLVIWWRASIILLPIGAWAFLAMGR